MSNIVFLCFGKKNENVIEFIDVGLCTHASLLAIDIVNHVM